MGWTSGSVAHRVTNRLEAGGIPPVCPGQSSMHGIVGLVAVSRPIHELLDGRTRRCTELRREIDGIGQRAHTTAECPHSRPRLMLLSE